MASIYTADPWNRSSSLLPKTKFKGKEGPKKTLPRGVGHYREFIRACKGQGETFSSFDIGGPLTELIQLANIAGQVGEPFHYDPITGEIPDHPNASHRACQLRRPARPLIHRYGRRGKIEQ